MKKAIKRHLSRVMAVSLIATGATSCVDHDYDLTEDIDLTLQLGGESLTVPTSSTDVITLSQILDLKEDSSIKTIETSGEYGLEKGDYALIQEGTSTPVELRCARGYYRNHQR